jgi:hypothetical protein
MDTGRITHELRNCKVCSAEFKFYEAVKNATGQYCSLQCKGVDFRHERPLKQCVICEKEFIASIGYKQKRFCSLDCYGQSMEGIEKPSFWETASEEEKINRLKQSYEKYVIRKDGCWDWSGCPSKPYGSLQYGGKYKRIDAHRGSWIIHNGDIPKGLFICHTCDNKRCTNPDHLFLGTPTDNVLDMIKKGRNNTQRGEKASGAKLKEKDVLEIIELLKTNKTMTSIAAQYGAHIVTIHNIKHKKTWKHLHD